MTDEEFLRIVKYTAVRYGINLYHKKVMVEGRLSNYLSANGFKSYTELWIGWKQITPSRKPRI